MDKEKVVAVLRGELTAELKVCLLVVLARLLVSGDFDCTTLTGRSLIAFEWFLECLVRSCDDFVDGELDGADQVVSVEVVEVVEVIDIIDCNFVVLTFLEVIGNFKVLDPLGVEVVHDDLRLANLFPKVSFFLEEDAHAISACERIQVWQIAALKREGNDVDEALIRGNASVCSRQNGVI